MTLYNVTVYVNVDPDFHFEELRPGQQIARVEDFTIEAEDELSAANIMWVIGNKEENLLTNNKLQVYPRDVRSLSVGDLLVITAGRGTTCYAVASFGFTEIPEPANPIVPLEGTAATSRPAAYSVWSMRKAVT